MQVGKNSKGGHVNFKHHYFFAIVVALLIVKFGLPFIPADAQPILFGSFLIFSVFITPDADLFLPFLRHRGISHSLLGVIILGVLLFGTLFVLGNRFQQFEYLQRFALWGAGAGMLGIMTHLLGDWINDRLKLHGLWYLIFFLVLVYLTFL